MYGPLPDRTHPEFAPFWAGCAMQQLLVPRCDVCGARTWPPRAICPVCGARDRTWLPVDGVGQLYSWTTVGRSPWPELAVSTPYTVVVVELEQPKGVRMLGTLANPGEHELKIGNPAQVRFEEMRDDVWLPTWAVQPTAFGDRGNPE